jgi:epoxyqueuosine reductase
MPFSSTVSAQIKQLALDFGFDLAGIAPVRELQELRYFEPWIDSGYAGEMRYLESRDDAGKLKRSSIETAAPWAKSVVVCALNYNTAIPYSTLMPDPAKGWISRYAWGKTDYHDVVLARLRALEARLPEFCSDPSLRTWSYVDTGPIVERVLARHAGIGWIGKNTCIINQQSGSWLFLGVVLTSASLLPDMPPADRCGTCTRCLDACPTHAFPAPYQLDATRCISYLTIEKRGSMPEELREGVGRHLFGCDICQDVCPWNRKAPVTSQAELSPRESLVNPPLEQIAAMSIDEFRQLFRGSPVKRAKYSGLRRNCAVAMGNSRDPKFAPYLQTLADDPDPVVAEHARWALAQLNNEWAV